MNDKKEKKEEIKFKIIGTKKDVVYDKFERLVPGFIIKYETAKGSPGFIEIPEKEYTKEKALKLIEEDTRKLEELF